MTILKNRKNKSRRRERVLFILCFLISCFVCYRVSAEEEEGKPIVINENEASIAERMERTITLNIRDMNIVDVIKFLAEQGQFNVVISPTVTGRVTVFLDNVSIKDSMDIVVISNNLAYKIQGNIVQVMSSNEYESMYGKHFNDKTQVAIIHLNYSKPSYVLAALDSIKSNVGKIIIDEDTGSVVIIDTPEAIASMKETISHIEKPLETFVYALQYADAETVTDKLRTRIDSKAVGSVSSDQRSNKLIVRAYPNRRKEIEDIIRELDVPTKEVMLNARILQVTFKPEYDVGIDWQLNFRDSSIKQLHKLTFSNFALGKQGPTASGSLAASDNLGSSSNYGQIAVGNIDVDSFQTTIRAFEKVSDTKILSNPQLLITNNEEAKIHVGDTIPYIISTTSGTGDNAITSEDVRFVDVGLKLDVRPTINDDGFITIRLRPEISSVSASVSSHGGGIPQVNKTEVETTVMVKDGHTIVIGGLKKDDKAHIKKGLPVLMDLPWVGPFFSRASDNLTKTEIVIFMTPHVVTGVEDYAALGGTIKPFKKYSTD